MSAMTYNSSKDATVPSYVYLMYPTLRLIVSDTGRIIPGHGGLLDRIDGMIFAYPFSYLIMFNNSYNI